MKIQTAKQAAFQQLKQVAAQVQAHDQIL